MIVTKTPIVETVSPVWACVINKIIVTQKIVVLTKNPFLSVIADEGVGREEISMEEAPFTDNSFLNTK